MSARTLYTTNSNKFYTNLCEMIAKQQVHINRKRFLKMYEHRASTETPNTEHIKYLN